MQVDNLNTFEKDEMLRWFLHWLPMERRREMMRRYPQSYNKLLGRGEFLTVQHPGREADELNKADPPHAIAKPECER